MQVFSLCLKDRNIGINFWRGIIKVPQDTVTFLSPYFFKVRHRGTWVTIHSHPQLLLVSGFVSGLTTFQLLLDSQIGQQWNTLWMPSIFGSHGMTGKLRTLSVGIILGSNSEHQCQTTYHMFIWCFLNEQNTSCYYSDKILPYNNPSKALYI